MGQVLDFYMVVEVTGLRGVGGVSVEVTLACQPDVVFTVVWLGQFKKELVGN